MHAKHMEAQNTVNHFEYINEHERQKVSHRSDGSLEQKGIFKTKRNSVYPQQWKFY